MTNQEFHPNRDSYNIESVNSLNVYNNAERDSPEGEQEDDESGSASAGGAGGIIAFAAFVILGYAVSGGGSLVPFPNKSDAWPEGVSEGQVASITNDWLSACSREVVAEPANCPQSLNDQSAKNAQVTWTLYGDPTDGAQIAFSAEDGKFNVLGTTVMVANYELSGNPARKVQALHYWAKVRWSKEGMHVEGIHAYGIKPATPITKRDPNASWPLVRAAVNQAFHKCARTKREALPAGCPSVRVPAWGEKVAWSVNGDPTLTATHSLDSRFGLVLVKGSYSLTATYNSTAAQEKTTSEAGTYEAKVFISEQTPVVLEITKES